MIQFKPLGRVFKFSSARNDGRGKQPATTKSGRAPGRARRSTRAGPAGGLGRRSSSRWPGATGGRNARPVPICGARGTTRPTHLPSVAARPSPEACPSPVGGRHSLPGETKPPSAARRSLWGEPHFPQGERHSLRGDWQSPSKDSCSPCKKDPTFRKNPCFSRHFRLATGFSVKVRLYY